MARSMLARLDTDERQELVPPGRPDSWQGRAGIEGTDGELTLIQYSNLRSRIRVRTGRIHITRRVRFTFHLVVFVLPHTLMHRPPPVRQFTRSTSVTYLG
jgi:hypothetical protein